MEVFGGVNVCVFLVAFALLGTCAAAFVDNSRTCSKIFEFFGVTMDFARATCASGTAAGGGFVAAGTGVELEISGCTGSGADDASTSLVGVFVFLVRVVVF